MDDQSIVSPDFGQSGEGNQILLQHENYNISNDMFLQAIFREQYEYAHVTSFTEDPLNIPDDKRGLCWGGGYYRDIQLKPNSNQFYAVSLFGADETDKSKRRKTNFASQHVVALDDVKEKLPLEQVAKLPPPSIVIKSSNNSEQWLYILKDAETDRNKLDNLTDGLINNGLAPNAKDPGMKGVTRYMRLPEGVNTKASRIEENGGVVPRCQVIVWNPELKYTLEDLAEPFSVDLTAPRRNTRISGAIDVPDHPVLEQLKVKEKNKPGCYDVVCPWLEEHTGQDDSGTAVFTNADGSIGFQCHHGHCEDRTAVDLIRKLEEINPKFTANYKQWKSGQMFKDVPGFMGVSVDLELMDVLDEIKNIRVEDSDFKPELNEENIRNAWMHTFQNPKDGKFCILNKKGQLVFFVETKAFTAIEETFGYFIKHVKDKGNRGAILKIVKSIFFKHVGLYRQRSKLNFVVDIFADKTCMDIKDDSVDVVLIHKPFVVGDYDLTIVDDYKKHFPDFDKFFEFLCAARFANDRRQAFLWLHAASDWGKGFLVVILEKLGIVTETSVKEIEKALEGSPLGKDFDYFLRSWVLVVDEFKTVKSEVKMLNNRISGSPKHQMSFTAPLYLKLFTSAEGVDSLAGSEGVEPQFANRFSYMNPKGGKLDDRPLFIKDKGAYMKSLANHTGRVINRLVEEMKVMGREKAAAHCDKILAAFNETHSIKHTFGLLDDSVEQYAEELREILIELSTPPFRSSKLNNPLNDWLKHNTVVDEHAKHGRVIVLKSPIKFIKDWLDTKADDSQKFTLRHKANKIAELANEGEDIKTTFRLKCQTKLFKGIIVKIEQISFI